MLAESDITLNQSANHPADAVSTAGGAISSPRVLVTNAVSGEILPRLLAVPSGDLDTDMVSQYQVGYVENVGGADTLGSPGVYCANFLDALGSVVALAVTGTSASDDSTKFLRVWGEVSSALFYEDVTLAGLTPVTTISSWTRVFRAELRLVSNGQVTTAAADIDIAASGGTSIGTIPQGYSVATREVAMAVAAALGDVGTFSNRVTEPAGLSWSYQRTEAGKLAMPADLGPGQKCAVYFRQQAQPGMGSIDLQLDFRVVGDN